MCDFPDPPPPRKKGKFRQHLHRIPKHMRMGTPPALFWAIAALSTAILLVIMSPGK